MPVQLLQIHMMIRMMLAARDLEHRPIPLNEMPPIHHFAKWATIHLQSKFHDVVSLSRPPKVPVYQGSCHWERVLVRAIQVNNATDQWPLSNPWAQSTKSSITQCQAMMTMTNICTLQPPSDVKWPRM